MSPSEIKPPPPNSIEIFWEKFWGSLYNFKISTEQQK